MISEDLFLALAHARPEYIAHCDKPQKHHKNASVRIFWIAAAIALLSCSVFAATVLRNYLTGAESKQENRPGISVDYHGNLNVYEGLAEVKLSLALEASRPQIIEDYFVPLWFAENWTMTEQQRPLAQQNHPNQTMSRLEWHDSQGGYAIFTQQTIDPTIQPDCPEFPFDIISTGYNNSCDIQERMIGNQQVYTVSVSPSELEVDGVSYSHPGFRKYYWSDGLYLFTLETAFDVPFHIIANAMESIAEVGDISAYVLIHYLVPEAPLEMEQQMQMWLPTVLPEGWELIGSKMHPDGCYTFQWRHQQDGSYSHLELMQVPTASQQSLIRDWETSREEVTKEQCLVGAWQVTIYQSQYKTQAFWAMEGFDYILTSEGRTILSLQEIVELIESMKPVEE